MCACVCVCRVARRRVQKIRREEGKLAGEAISMCPESVEILCRLARVELDEIGEGIITGSPTPFVPLPRVHGGASSRDACSRSTPTSPRTREVSSRFPLLSVIRRAANRQRETKERERNGKRKERTERFSLAREFCKDFWRTRLVSRCVIVRKKKKRNEKRKKRKEKRRERKKKERGRTLRTTPSYRACDTIYAD